MKFVFLFLTFLIFVQSIYANSSAVVFIYHRFGESKYPSTNIRMEQFKEHLEYLKKNNFNVWPLSQIIKHIQEKKDIPPKTVAITMDDAYKSVYTKAYPLLREMNYPFTVFVHTSAISKASNSYMDWEDMKEMLKDGAEFSSHSYTHDYILPLKNETKNEWQKRIKNELTNAQKELQKELGEDTNTDPKMIAYPYGEYTQESAKYIRSLGYVGIAQTSGAISFESDLKAIPRFPMSEIFGEIKSFALKANTLALPVVSEYPNNTIADNIEAPRLRIKLTEDIRGMNCFTADGEAIDIKWLSKLEARISAKKPLNTPRDRYTCTARHSSGRWYWYSHLWIVKDD
ncbi:polysaccharide deacetylase family protein [Sulfurimonas sp.]|uniref:polysaccharide deacetylase family protein n=1 Tax=Sulfurimonas sp. TaxID=2022749 RepID=UPI003568B885